MANQLNTIILSFRLYLKILRARSAVILIAVIESQLTLTFARQRMRLCSRGVSDTPVLKTVVSALIRSQTTSKSLRGMLQAHASTIVYASWKWFNNNSEIALWCFVVLSWTAYSADSWGPTEDKSQLNPGSRVCAFERRSSMEAMLGLFGSHRFWEVSNFWPGFLIMLCWM